VPDVDALREQLRARGYLTHGIERWFALDPWSSRTFWSELLMVALKAAILIGAFGALPPAAVMVLRNAPVGIVAALLLLFIYAVTLGASAFALVIVVALILKVRPALPIDTPRALLAISLAAAALLVIPLGVWWYGFESPPRAVELVAGGGLVVIFLLVATITISAALLSFSIYEVQRIPAIHRRPTTTPMAIAAIILMVLIFVPVWTRQEAAAAAPMIVTRPTTSRIALIAVDGLTWDLLRSRTELSGLLPHARAVPPIVGESAAERWASLGTGVRTARHGVRSIEGVRIGSTVLQRISSADVALRQLAPAMAIARREPLPPSVRRRDYPWEIVSDRGLPAAAVNWWATSATSAGALEVVGPEIIFSQAGTDPLRIDTLATALFLERIEAGDLRLASIYLPSLDVILNRVERDPSERLATSIRALENLANLVAHTKNAGYEVILIGMPGETQTGTAVVAASEPTTIVSAWDVAPTILARLGFPLSQEMPGGRAGDRIASYGARKTEDQAPVVNEEYYENLRSLGYIR
jgi:hypothetical protein